MLNMTELLRVLNSEPEAEIDIELQDLQDSKTSWAELSQQANRNAYILKRLSRSSESLSLIDDRVVFLPKREN
ncbi:hypothetical protein [Hyphomonas sp.]|uniref:hypothetical protein n=1 Tax=Hyphomonas sp. TaxID=87 RepID=UPI00356947BA